MSGNRTKPRDPTSTSYMRGWKDKKNGKPNSNPFQLDGTSSAQLLYDKYNQGYNDTQARKMGLV